MKFHILERSQRIEKPLDEVFRFFEQPENLSKITPPGLKFKLLNPSPVKMKKELVLNYEIRPMFFKMGWTSLIAEYNPPHSFVDLQIKGPYAFWHHTHRFAREDNATRVFDRVVYQLPAGPLGRLMHTLHVRRQLESIFNYRETALKRFFPEGK